MKTDTYTPTKVETKPPYRPLSCRALVSRHTFTWPVKEYEAVDDEGYCALGVIWYGPGRDAHLSEIRTTAEEASCPVCGVSLWIGASLIAHWNDHHRLTFKEIADLAEAYPHLVFTEAQS